MPRKLIRAIENCCFQSAQPQPRAAAPDGLKSGDVMVDIGAGPGFFTVPAAEIVGERDEARGGHPRRDAQRARARLVEQA
jgi:hypothetical protein